MSSPIVRFLIFGPDLDRLRAFYREALGWESFVVVDDFAVVETSPHEHDPETGADIGRAIAIEGGGGAMRWRYADEQGPRRPFTPGTPEGGIGRGEPQVMVSAEVDDLDAALARVVGAGGTVTLPPTAIPGYTTVARIRDVAGNEIGLQVPAEG